MFASLNVKRKLICFLANFQHQNKESVTNKLLLAEYISNVGFRVLPLLLMLVKIFSRQWTVF